MSGDIVGRVYVARRHDGATLVDVEALALLTGRTPATIARRCLGATSDGLLYYADLARQALADAPDVELVTTAEATARTGVPGATIRSWVRRRLLAVVEPGTRPRYAMEDIVTLARHPAVPA